LPRTLTSWGSGAWRRRAASGSCASSAWCEALVRNRRARSGRQARYGAAGYNLVLLPAWRCPIHQPTTNSNLAVQHMHALKCAQCDSERATRDAAAIFCLKRSQFLAVH
jgi:hypothetical protein